MALAPVEIVEKMPPLMKPCQIAKYSIHAVAVLNVELVITLAAVLGSVLLWQSLSLLMGFFSALQCGHFLPIYTTHIVIVPMKFRKKHTKLLRIQTMMLAVHSRKAQARHQ